jgi:hypothetical protein
MLIQEATYSTCHLLPFIRNKFELISPIGFAEKPPETDIKRIKVMTLIYEKRNEISNPGPLSIFLFLTFSLRTTISPL